ncbi:uncharacterized protein LAESUDRAFT_662093 [Laetiporus sulphureus 93-53]|uniref:F-box domain-containing protein n=1 Tax=Laetiporus sulphureus 93-53 TaxID=1314785 RepID=A0A165C7T6_9APHY|nr:uncharacterized protein LAESUDRAFT_662093 [Laetiporus sulphureus 93-53]KZT02349.1 hypothetical protein LAESUDRAFT_662093 [Laetiporus sulphureus 93-53]
MSIVSPKFPQELVDMIIDYLWDDRPALMACSLTCRPLSNASRTHLFGEVCLEHEAACTSFEQLVEQSPHFALHIRKLSIKCRHFCHDLTYQPSSAWVAWIPALMAKLPRLEDLEFAFLDWSRLQFDAERTKMLSMHLARLRRLALSDIHFQHPSDVREILIAASNLQELLLFRIFFTCYGQGKPRSPPDVPIGRNLQRISLRATVLPLLLKDWLLLPEYPLNLRYICVQGRDESTANALGGFLRSSAASLRHVDIEFPSGAASIMHDEVDLSPLTELRSFSFGGLIASESCAWLLILLSQITSNHLETVKVSMLAIKAQDLLALDWAQLDETLSHARFSRVELTMYIKLSPSRRIEIGIEQAHRIVTTSLPHFQKHGTLRVKAE